MLYVSACKGAERRKIEEGSYKKTMKKASAAKNVSDDELTSMLTVSIDLGGTLIRIALMRGTTIYARMTMPTGPEATPETVLEQIDQALKHNLNEADLTWNEVAGIGISAPGPLDNQAGIICSPPNLPRWRNVPLRDMLQEQYQKPVWLENDANAAALGEYLFGAGRGCHEMVYLTVSTGIGGGIISEGRLFEGKRGTAGELGHMTIDWQGERCPCGNVGCLELFASGTAIARQARRAIAEERGSELRAFLQAQAEHGSSQVAEEQSDLPGQREVRLASNEPPRVTAQAVALAAQAGIPLACEIIERAALALGVGLVNILHVFSPELIILGGGVIQMGERFLEPALRIVQERAMGANREQAQIVLAQLGSDAGLIGAGALPLYAHSARALVEEA